MRSSVVEHSNSSERIIIRPAILWSSERAPIEVDAALFTLLIMGFILVFWHFLDYIH